MRITRYGHSCLLVEDGDARLLLDPGVFSTGFEDLRGLTAVLVTHQHPDHLDVARLTALLEANPDAVVRLKGESQRPVRARRVEGDERERLWRRWADIDEGLDAYAASRSADTQLVVFEPIS